MRQTPQHTEPEHVRRGLAEDYAKEAGNRRWKKTERTTFKLMSESWARTLPKGEKKS